ncbi:hypothetical protein BCR32DRAFT_229565 [Anaeromyces robustus]|uniref:HMG box domain-containing protein n=1 Tax=Anaeromyces robustus TaxID=1754192 RepID=A0A1Y1XIJ9_9FUNG|nr:hypothetical protein BCR32DRAFT_229565 [Anaeromyces robustus]|eukprot:ORX85587.1 hypothetical protein BCR32DRAFT_229565 [Anaeromyces robustus]
MSTNPQIYLNNTVNNNQTVNNQALNNNSPLNAAQLSKISSAQVTGQPIANYGQLSMNNIGVNMNTIGMTINNNNGIQVNGLNNISVPRVNLMNNSIAVGNTVAATTLRNGNYGMVNIANQNVANVQLRNGLNNTATIGGNRIISTAGLTYANANPIIQQRVTANQVPTANLQTSNIYNTYPLNTNIVNVGKKNVSNLSPVNNATNAAGLAGNVGQRLVQTYTTNNIQTTPPLQAQNIQLLNQSTVITNPVKTSTPTVVPQQKATITTPVQPTSALNLQNKFKTSNDAIGTTTATTNAITNTTDILTPVSKINEKLNQTPIQTVKNETITTPIASSTTTINTLTPNSEGINESAKINNNSKETVKIEKTDINEATKKILSTPVSETKDITKNQLPTSTVTTQSQNTGLVTPTNYQVVNGTEKRTNTTLTATTNKSGVSNSLAYNQGQNMYQKQYIAAPTTAINYPQTAVQNGYQVNKAFYPAGTNQTTYLNQYATVKSIAGNTLGIQQQIPQKYYTIANGTYSNANGTYSNANGTVQTGIKTINPTAPVSYTVANNQKYVVTNPITNTVLNNRVQGVSQYPVNNTITNVYQVSNNNTVKVSNGYIPNNNQVVMNTINNGQVSYVKVNPTVNGNVISNATNLVNYNGTNTTVVNPSATNTNPYLNKTANLTNPTLLANGRFAKTTTTNAVEPNSKYLMNNPISTQVSSFLMNTPPVSSTTSSRRRNDILRPPNPFILYRQEHHSKVLAEHEGISNTEISKIIGKMWKNESEEVKNKYKEKAQEMKRRHKLMYPDYRFAPRKQEEIRRRKKRKNITPESTTSQTTASTAATTDDKKENDVKKEEVKVESTLEDSTIIENAKKKLKKEDVSINSTKDGLDFLNDITKTLTTTTTTTNTTTENKIEETIKTEVSNSNIPATTDDSNNIITSTSLFSDLDTNLSNINSFDIENFDITDDNSFIDNYLNFNSSHTFQTTSDSMFNQLTDLLNNGKK